MCLLMANFSSKAGFIVEECDTSASNSLSHNLFHTNFQLFNLKLIFLFKPGTHQPVAQRTLIS